MNDLIEALQIFAKYLPDPQPHAPTHCEHDELWIVDVDPEDVSIDDRVRLDDLGFFVDGDGFKSFRFGSA